MIFVGIDVAKNRHDCFVINSDGEVLFDVFTIFDSPDKILSYAGLSPSTY